MDGARLTAENHLRVVHADTPEGTQLAVGYIYVILNPSDYPCYVGSCRDAHHRGRDACLARRMSLHRNQAARDPMSSPLYRAAGGSMGDWKIIWLRTVEWDNERLPLSLLKEEENVRRTLAVVFDLHNSNRAIDPVQRRRDYMREWRLAHGQGTADSYMARKARERRQAIQNVANGGLAV